MSDDGWRWSATFSSIGRTITGKRSPKNLVVFIAIAALVSAVVPSWAGPRPAFRAPAPAPRPMPPPIPDFAPRPTPPAVRHAPPHRGQAGSQRGSHSGGAGENSSGTPGRAHESAQYVHVDSKFGAFRSMPIAADHEHRMFALRAARHAVQWDHRHPVHWAHRYGWYALFAVNGVPMVIDVPSGDTITVRGPSGLTQTVRLFGTAAPQFGEPFALKSKENLESLVRGKVVNVQTLGADIASGAPVAMVFCDETYVNRAQIAAGMAWNYVEDGLDVDLAEAEAQAKAAGVGIWSDDYQEIAWGL
jgi:endonuclease YncB( thermonuclease family)